MSSGGLSVRALAAPNMPSTSLRWVEMVLPTPGPDGKIPPNAQAAVTVLTKTNDYVRTIKDPLNMISVIGPARSGKSTLMNLLSGSTSDLFPTSSGAVTFTKGMYIPNKVFTLPEFSAMDGEPTVDSPDPNIKITFIDTEGQGALGDVYDMNLFSPALLCSKTIIYNRIGALLTHEILTQLGMMTQAAQRLTTKPVDSSNGTNGTSSGPLFGHLVILFNRFQLNATSSIETLRSNLFDSEDSGEAAAQERNQIRKLLQSCFSSISIYILPDNQIKPEVLDEMETNPDRFLTLQDFRPKYLQYFKTLRTGLSNILGAPHQIVPKVPLTGGAIADFVPNFAEAINSKEPLNVPSIFESSRNDAINRGLTKFRQDLNKNMDELAKEDGKPAAALSRVIDSDISLLLADLDISLSYMPQDVLQKLHTDAIAAAKPIKDAALATNFAKLQAIASTLLNTAVSTLGTTIAATFTDDKLLVTKESLKTQLDQIKTPIYTKYEADVNSYDPQSAPADWRNVLDSAFNVQADSVNKRYAEAWAKWVREASSSNMSLFSQKVDQLAEGTPAGDKNSWTKGLRRAITEAKDAFTSQLNQSYNGPDRATVEKQFSDSVDAAAATRQAQWEEDDTEVRNQLQEALTTAQNMWWRRVTGAIVPQFQPPAFQTVTSTSVERGNLENFITSNKIATNLGNSTLSAFDMYVSDKLIEYRTIWQAGMTNFNTYFQDQLDQRRSEWQTEYYKKMGAVDLNNNPAQVSSNCDQIYNLAVDRFNQFKALIGQLQPDSVAAAKMSNADRELANLGEQTKKAKLNQFDELAALFNRALLNKLTRPIIEKTLSDSATYDNIAALDQALENARREFNTSARPLSSSEAQTPEKQWADFKKRSYNGLVENVRRNGMAFGLDGTEKMPVALQREVLKNIWRDCANMANVLGFSWISGSNDVFSGEAEVTDSAIVDNQALRELTRTFFMPNIYQCPPDNNFWSDRRTSLRFFDWVLEPSEYQLGTPVVTEQKPLMLLSQQYPAQSSPRMATVTSNLSTTSTVSSSATLENSWGAKAGVDIKGKAFGAEITTKLEASYGGKFATTDTTSFQNTFSITGSSTVELPPHVVNTVTQVGFDQKCTIPYTAKYKLVPRLRLEGGFVRAGGVYLRRDYFDKNKDTNRVYKNFDFTRTDEIRQVADRDSDGVWRWKDFKNDHGNDWYWNHLAQPDSYTFYVRGKWEGLTGKLVITTVSATQGQYALLPEDN